MRTSHSVWPAFNQVIQRDQLMDRMVEACDVDLLFAMRKDGGRAYAEARSKCIFCLHASACREWLRFSLDPERAPDFCPNADFYFACRRKP